MEVNFSVFLFDIKAKKLPTEFSHEKTTFRGKTVKIKDVSNI